MLKILHPNANKPPSPKNKHCIIKTEHNDKKAGYCHKIRHNKIPPPI